MYKKGFGTIIAVVLVALLAGAGVGYNYQSNLDTSEQIDNIQDVMIIGADTQKYFGGFPYYIAGSGVSASSASITLTKLTLPQNDYPIQDSDLSSTFYITIEPGDKDRQEFASCTTVGTNTGGNVTLSGCTRGLAPISPYTASTTLQFAHSGASAVIFSNSPNFYDQFAGKGNDETITGTWLVPTPTEATQIANKTYTDNVANAGAATSTESNGGIVELGTLAEQASGFSGGATKPTVLQTKNSSSSPDVRGTYNIVAEADGYLDQDWIRLTDGFDLNEATTTNATTTDFYISGDLGVNGLYYNFPTSETATSSTLQTDGSGGLSWIVPKHEEILASTTLSVASTTIQLTGIPAATDYRIVFETKGVRSTADNMQMRFNGVHGTSYSSSAYTGHVFQEQGKSGTRLNLTKSTTSPMYLEIKVSNNNSEVHWVNMQGTSQQNSGEVPLPLTSSGIWENTAKITQINVGNFDTASTNYNMAIGTRLTIYGIKE